MSVKKVLEDFGEYVRQQARTNLTKGGKRDRSTLYNGTDYNVLESESKTELTFTFGDAEDYWQFVDKGVKGKTSSAKAPNSPFKFGTGSGTSGGLTSGIKGWVSRKRIQFKDKKTGRFLSYESTSFLIIRSIWNKGLATTNFFTTPFEKGFERVPDDVYEAYALEVEEQLKVILK